LFESEFETNPSGDDLCIEDHQVFGNGFFQNNPAFLSRFNLRDSSRPVKKHREFRQSLARYEKRFVWHTVTGPGFCGATHPGAAKVFSSIATAAYGVSNSDCLYVNPSERVFAISDAPEASGYSRALLTYIDKNLMDRHRDLANLINSADSAIGADDHATLSLLHIPGEQMVNPPKAWAFMAGDTLLFRGNRFSRSLVCMDGTPNFIGKSHGHCEPRGVDLAVGDFFVIASDGIRDVRANDDETIEESLRDLLDVDDLYGSTLAIVRRCNRVIAESRFGLTASYLGGYDNISILLIYPERLPDCVRKGAALLGGWTKFGEE
jgi:hypothetical protein